MTKHTIRMATLEDAERILEIYNPYIENTCITFEYDRLSLPSFQKRMNNIMECFPWIVLELNGLVVGYAYASPYHTRAAYSWNCNGSIYIDSAYHGQGIGSVLYKTLFEMVKAMGYYNIYALVTSANPASLKFHDKLGFIMEGNQENTGFKFGKWLGTTSLVKRLGDFSRAPSPIIPYKRLDFTEIYKLYTSTIY